MKRLLTIAAVIGLFCFSLSAAPAQAASMGQWTKTLGAKYCGSRSSQKGWGCWAFTQYHLDYNMEKGKAMSTCNWACGKVGYGASCKEGCQHGLNMRNAK